METSRAAKRRKLVDPDPAAADGLSGSSRRRANGGRDSVPSSHGSPAAVVVGANGFPAQEQQRQQQQQQQQQTVHERWEEAKLKRRAAAAAAAAAAVATEEKEGRDARGTARGRDGLREVDADADAHVDVYDDIVGAHAQREEPLGRMRGTTTAVSTPAKRRLDLLRNQRSNPGPVRAQSGKMVEEAAGFFKQFASPRKEGGSTARGKVGEKELGRGRGGNAAARKSEDGHRATMSSPARKAKDDEDSVSPATRSSGRRRVPSRKYDEARNGARSAADLPRQKPGKTFEDEFKELQEAAKEEVDQSQQDEDQSVVQERRGNGQMTPVRRRGAQRPAQKASASRPQSTDDRDCVQEAALEPENQDDGMEIDDSEVDQEPKQTKKTKRQPVRPASPVIKVNPVKESERGPVPMNEIFDVEHVQAIKTILLDRVTHKKPTALLHLDEEYKQVSSVITQTITAGESNSILLIGARGSGKTALVNRALHEQTAQHQDDFHVVKLNGFIHTDDKVAVREIWRQLGQEMKLDEKENVSKSLADTLTTLLALLSHPAEQGRDEADQMSKSVIFVLDEFDLFAGHSRQTLLYNLLDIAQSRKAPIAVLGLTTKIDVAESLEKRVKSRFSHRYVHLGLAKSLPAFRDACKALVSIQQEELSEADRERFEAVDRKISATKRDGGKGKVGTTGVQKWKRLVETIFEDTAMSSLVNRLYYTTKSLPEFAASMLLPVSSLNAETASDSTRVRDHFADTISAGGSLSAPGSKLSLLASLSALHLALLVCGARLTTIHNAELVSFAQAYEEYKGLGSKAKIQASASGALAQGATSRVWGREVARGAWEELCSCGLVMASVDADGGARAGSRGCRIDVALEEIGMAGGVELGQWRRWCREI